MHTPIARLTSLIKGVSKVAPSKPRIFRDWVKGVYPSPLNFAVYVIDDVNLALTRAVTHLAALHGLERAGAGASGARRQLLRTEEGELKYCLRVASSNNIGLL